MPPIRPAFPTFLDCGAQRVRALCNAIGFDESFTGRALELFCRLTDPWSTEPIESSPSWSSDITDDHTPFEFSLAVERSQPELRILAEARPREPNAIAQWRAGRALSESLAEAYGVPLARLHAIEDLFAVTDRRARFGMWHAANLRAGAAPEIKVYLNPQAHGKGSSREVVDHALARLGFAGALNAMPLSGTRLEEVKYFSLDLHPGADARVKVYLALHRATCTDIESALSVAANYVPREAAEFCAAMAGSTGPYLDLPLQLCYSFTTRGGLVPASATLYFPVRGYVESDDVARRRILAYMDPEDRPLYERAITAFSNRPLDDGVGMQTYASYRRQNGSRRVTVYLSPEAYHVAPRRGGTVFDPHSSGVISSRSARALRDRAARASVESRITAPPRSPKRR